MALEKLTFKRSYENNIIINQHDHNIMKILRGIQQKEEPHVQIAQPEWVFLPMWIHYL